MKKPLIKNTARYDEQKFRMTLDKRTVTAALTAALFAVGLGKIFGSIYLGIIVFVAVFLLSVGRVEGMSMKEYIKENNLQIRRKDYAHDEERLLIRKKNTKGK